MPKFKIIGSAGRDKVVEYINRLPDNGKQWDVSITPHRIKRTVLQNSLYWLWVGLVAKDTGNLPDVIHEVFKEMFLDGQVVELGEVEVVVRPSTTKLDTRQFMLYLERIEAWVTSELGIVLPHPEDAFWEDFMQEYGAL